MEFAEIRVSGADPWGLEWAAAEAFEAGARGVEERDAPHPVLVVYAAEADAPRILAALRALPIPGLRVGDAARLPPVVWAEAWKQGLVATVVSERLLVRPPFAEAPAGFAGADLVIEPGQAFGTGAHGSTRLALELLDGLPRERVRGARVLDVGCGSGVLALAALALGAAHAVGCDIDPLAPPAACSAAAANGLGRLDVFTGSVDAVGAAFDIVLANMIRREVVPLLEPLATRLAPGGALILSGLLQGERATIAGLLAPLGLRVTGAADALDDRGDHWIGLGVSRSG